MDRHTLDIIDFDRIRQILAEHTNCALGRQKALKIKPAISGKLIKQWSRQVTEMIEAGSYTDLPPFGGIHDIRAAVQAAVPPHCLEPDDFAIVAETLDATHSIVNWVNSLREDATELRAVCENIGDFKSIGDAIHRIVDTKGEIRDDASAKLRKIRTDIANAKISIGHVVDRLLRNKNVTRWLRYPQATFHDDRLVLPLAAEYRGRVSGIVHRSSDSGATLFVEPAEAVELNNKIISLKADETAEINRLLWHLTHLVQVNSKEILKTLDTLAIIDLIVAKVRFAWAYDMACPHISTDGKLQLNQARHPLLVQMQKEARARSEDMEVVPINIRLGDDFDVLVITGPNTGGKTVALKTVALHCAMAQAGLPIPAKPGSQVPIYTDILVDIGDEQSMQQSLSTFSAHLKRLMVILKRARAKTLILIDELGAGTDPDEGAALGRAMVTELLERRCPCLVTTHLGVLKSLAYTEGRAENACVDFDPQTLRPTYRLLIGEPGNSNAINIAERLGLPKELIEGARHHLSGSHEQLTRAIKGTLLSRRQAERARAEAEDAKLQAQQQKQAAEQELKDLQDQQDAFQKWVNMILSLRPGDEVHVKQFDRSGKVVRMQLHKQLAVVSVGAMEIEVPIRELTITEKDN
ncbi:MAG: DNA strand exchange inhibitor protein [Planctomycetota bacterium]|nr:MAG: DNA strand exchange inhibitor protein [Planctomycetota bacterium]